MGRAIRWKDVQVKTSLSRSSAYRGMKEGWFPKSFQIGPNSRRWDEDEVEAYLELCRASRAAPAMLRPRRPVGRPRKNPLTPGVEAR